MREAGEITDRTTPLAMLSAIFPAPMKPSLLVSGGMGKASIDGLLCYSATAILERERERERENALLKMEDANGFGGFSAVSDFWAFEVAVPYVSARCGRENLPK
ncbi:hypothetical protein TIFTF001_053473 [Ficus carica]|uniref:Uncharacterized protein n=1 Tax=Ficus carica TaxID=3494 RepID=A0AA88EF35_FICCA|nr:hypothetical protein TIFTF001_053473 [Ficus carica]